MKRFLRSLRVAFAGWRIGFRDQRNFRIHLAAATFATGAGFFFGISRQEWGLLVLTMALVLVAELANSAIEYLVDLVSPTYDVRAGKIKDVAAGFVLMAAVAAVVVGAIIFGPRLLHYFRAE